MSSNYQTNVKSLSAAGTAKLKEMSESAAVYTAFLKFQGRVFKHDAAVALEFFAQRPEAGFIATAKQWAAAGYRIKDGGEAIRFVDRQGNHRDLFDFSQVKGSYAPTVWTISKENAAEIKSALGIPEDKSLIGRIVSQTVSSSQITDCMAALGIPPKDFESFGKTYIGAVHAAVAGRLEIGGNKFTLDPDSSAFSALQDDARKMGFLSAISDAARNALIRIEKTANEINSKKYNDERTESNDLQGMGNPDGGGTGERTGASAPGDPERGTGERSAHVTDGPPRRTEVLGNPDNGRTGSETVSRIQAEDSLRAGDMVQVQPDVGHLQHEPDRRGAVYGRGTHRDIRDGMDEVDGGASPALGGAYAPETHLPDGGAIGGQLSLGIQGITGEPVQRTEPAAADIRGERSVQHNDDLLRRQRGDEGEGPPAGNRAVNERSAPSVVSENKLFGTYFSDRSAVFAAGNTVPAGKGGAERPRMERDTLTKLDNLLAEQEASAGSAGVSSCFAEKLTVIDGTAYYLFHNPDPETPALLSHETLSLITEGADRYVICADLCNLSEDEQQQFGIEFRKMPRDWDLLPETVQERIAAINPSYIEAFHERKKVIISDNFLEDIPPAPKAPPTRAEKLYTQFAEMYPQIVSGEYAYMRFGNQGDALEPLSVEHLGGDRYSFMMWYVQEGDLMRDPDFEFTLDKEAKTLNIHEYQQDGVPGIGTVYERVHDDNGRADEKLLASLEKNFAQVLKTAKDCNRPLAEVKDEQGNTIVPAAADIRTGASPVTNDNIAEDESAEYRHILNDFSLRHGFGELHLDRYHLVENLKDGSTLTIGDIGSPPKYDVPHTPETLKAALEYFEKNVPDLTTRYQRPTAIENTGGITPLPPMPDKLPEIVYAENPRGKFYDNLAALNELKRLELAEENNTALYIKYVTEEESEYRLSRYCGWGGLSQVFDERYSQWEGQRRQLREVLTREEYDSARESTLNAHYTPQVIIDAMYKAVTNMGVPWIDGEDYTKFLHHLSGRTSVYSRRCDVHYSPVTGEFEIMNAGSKKELNLNESTTYGTSDYSMYQLADKILNQRRIVVQKEVPDPKDSSKTITKTDARATKNALDKARRIKEEFNKWIFSDLDRREKYTRRYNDLFNCLVGREYDGSKLSFPGMNSDFILRDHQKDAIARATLGGNALVAHVVGAGKSAVMFASVMRKKELGLIHKACVVVPKALTEQIAGEWRRLYPDARILTVTTDDLSSEAKRNLFTARVATGSYDAVVLSQEQFEKIPMSRKCRLGYMVKQLDALEDMLRDRKRDNRGKADYSIKNLELEKKRLKAKLERLVNPKSATKAKDDLLEFEQLGFDYLVADEAHAYKNGFVVTKMTNVAGVTTRPSGRAEDMQMKCDYFNETLGQGHIMMSTGTPVSNSMTELYVMTRYLRPDLLEQAGISRFDDWAATFGNVTTQLEPTAYETYKLKTRFSQFANLPELMSLYKEFADIKSAEKLELPRPKLSGGKNTIINVPASPEQRVYVRELSERAEAINSGSVKPHEDNFLKITGEARLVGLGNGAVKSLYTRRGEELPPDFVDTKNGKVDVCAQKVHEIWQETQENRGVQLIFSDIAVSDEDDRFSLYEYIKQELISKGIPENEILFAPKADSKERENIFKRINAGEVRVVIASTGTLGTGANIQQKLTALHHADIPWKPSDFEQREGRILRQGNENEEVQIYNYVTESTLDSYLYATVVNKARFIAQILDNDAPARVSEDMDEKVLTYAEIQAVAAGNPDIKERIETANALAELHMLKREWAYEASHIRHQVETLPGKIEKLRETLAHIDADKIAAGKIAANPFSDKFLLAKVHQAADRFKTGDTEPQSIGTVGGFEVMAAAEKRSYTVMGDNGPVQIFDTMITVKGEHQYSFEAGMDEGSKNSMRLENLLKSVIPKQAETVLQEIEQLSENLLQAQRQVDAQFEHEGKIGELTQLLEKLDAKLSGITRQEDVVLDPEEIPLVETAEEKAAREELYDTDENDYQPVAGGESPQTMATAVAGRR